MNNDEQLRESLQSAFKAPVERERDLWPRMHERLERPQITVPWFEWALAGAALVLLAATPTAIPILLYWL